MPDRPIELGLRPGDPQDEDGGRSLRLLDRTMAAVPGWSASPESAPARAFKDEIAGFRRRLSEATNPPSRAAIVGECLDACDRYFTRTRTLLTERETELSAVIQTLREAVAELAGESACFAAEMAGASERLGGLADLDDVRELKAQISQEVRELKRMAAERQQRDTVAQSRLSDRIGALEDQLTEAQREARLDPLTRIANRGAFDRAIRRWAEDPGRDHPFVLVMVDLDDFKVINDRHGHPIGDRVLLCTAQWLGRCIRSGDFLARYGGEEFAVLLDGMRMSQAEKRVSDLLKQVSASRYEYSTEGRATAIAFTFSAGLSEWSKGDTADELVARADAALYDAKRAGKNCVVGRRRGLFSLFTRRASA